MRVEVRLFANLRERFPREARGRGSIELSGDATVQDLIDRLEISERLAQMVLVDGQQVPRARLARAARPLKEGEIISIFPPVAGG